MQKQVNRIIEEIAKKHNLPDYVVEEIRQSMMRFVKSKIEDGEFKTIMLQGWGKYTPSKRKLEWKRKHNGNNSNPL